MDYIRQQSLLTNATATNPLFPFDLWLAGLQGRSYEPWNLAQQQFTATDWGTQDYSGYQNTPPPNKARAFQLLAEARERHPEWVVKRLDAKRDIFGDYRHNGVNWDCFDGIKWVPNIDNVSEFFAGLPTAQTTSNSA